MGNLGEGFLEKLKELSPHLSFKNKGVMNRSKAFKLIKEPKPCPSKGFLPLLCFSKHYPSHLLNHNVYNLKKIPKSEFPVEFITPSCSEADLVGMSRRSKRESQKESEEFR